VDVQASVAANIVSVAFTSGSTKIGTGTVTNDFTVSWKLSTPGTYTIGAVGTDSNGAHYYPPGVTFTAVEDVPPTVTVASPTSGTTYVGPTNVPLEASANSSDGVIEKVVFYNGSTKLGDGPDYEWKNIPAGTYSITAVATDNYGISTTSAPVTLIITPDVPPTAAITYPASGSTYASGSTIYLLAAASSTDGAVESVSFYNGSTKLKTDAYEPYDYNWPKVAAGTYTITAVATDNYGVSTTSAPITIIVNP
jgi:hypothetical protein